MPLVANVHGASSEPACCWQRTGRSKPDVVCPLVFAAGLVNVLAAAGVEFGAMRATVTSALVRVFGTALALWIPLMPLFFIMRRALNGKTNTR